MLQSHPTQRFFKRVKRLVSSYLLKKKERDRRERGGGTDVQVRVSSDGLHLPQERPPVLSSLQSGLQTSQKVGQGRKVSCGEDVWRVERDGRGRLGGSDGGGEG